MYIPGEWESTKFKMVFRVTAMGIVNRRGFESDWQKFIFLSHFRGECFDALLSSVSVLQQ